MQLEARSLSGPAQWVLGSKRVKLSVNFHKNVWIFLALLKKLSPSKFRAFQMTFNHFLFCLTFSVLEKLKNLNCEIAIVPETANINN